MMWAFTRLWLATLLGLSGVLSVASVHAQSGWPQPALPDQVQAFNVGEQLTANGLPMRVQGFVATNRSVADLVSWFHRSWGEPLMESTLGNKRILGRLQGGYYLTVQLEPSGQGAKGLVAVTHVAGQLQHQDRYTDSNTRWLARWPGDSKMTSHTASQAAGKVSTTVVLTNGQSESQNLDTLKTLMAQDGWVLERETSSDPRTALADRLRNSKALFFKGEGKEAVAVMGRNPQGQVSLTLSTVTALETFKK